jgi:heme/copper-type cytochrome/quinol oxidase subunit 2
MSRHHKNCQYCGAELPQHMMDTEAQKNAEFKSWKKSDKLQREKKAEKDAEERARRTDLD